MVRTEAPYLSQPLHACFMSNIISNTGDPPGYGDLVTHIQENAEHAKAELARVLHDDVGGLMVAALMDLVWVGNHLSAHPAGSTEKLRRVESSLRAAIDLERRLIEELRPTLLDHVGLFAALRWQLNARCSKAGIKCVYRMPPKELLLTPAASIALYRIAEESLNILLNYALPTLVSLEITSKEGHFQMRFEHDGVSDRRSKAGDRSLAALQHRINLLGGELNFEERSPQGSHLSVAIPASNVLQQADA
jgi:signal transduction histidine kinase